MSESTAASRVDVPPLVIVAAALFLCVGLFPLPLLIPDDNGFWRQMIHFWVGAGILTLGPVAALASLPLGSVRRFPMRCAALIRRPSPLVFAALAMLVTTALSVLLAVYAYHRSATTADEIAQLWHAKILLHGRFSLPVDPNPEFFAVDNVVDTGRWYSQFPVGGPIVLAFGYLIHAPWLVNPILGGLSAAAVYLFARHAYGETQGRVSAALFALTPVILLMSASYMNHVPVLFLATTSLAVLAAWERACSRARAALYAGIIGLALGLMATIRPLDAVVVSVVIGAFQVSVIRTGAKHARDLVVQAIAGAIGVAPLLIANSRTTGGALHFGYEVLWGSAHRLGFHLDPQGTVHTPLRALYFAVKYVSELNVFVSGWSVPAVLILIIALLSMTRVTRWDALLLGLFGAQVIAYALYWHDGEFLGPRFLYTALPTVVVFLARAPFLVGQRFGGYWRHAAPLLALTCVGVSWTIPMTPYGALGMAQQVHDVRNTFKVDIAAAVEADHVHHALVLVHEPMSGRLERRLWGIGMSRSDAARLFAQSDACSLLEALRSVEDDSAIAPIVRAAMVTSRSAPFVPGHAAIRALDPTIHISSEQSLTPACRAELALDAQYGAIPFGPALLLEPIDRDGRIDGDVVYVTDLGTRNTRLRARFGDRAWYRFSAQHLLNGSLHPVITPY